MLSWIKKSRLVKFVVYLVIFSGILVGLLAWQIGRMSHLIADQKAIIAQSDQIQVDFEGKLAQYQDLQDQAVDEVFELRPKRESVIDILDDFEKLGQEYDLEVKINSGSEGEATNLSYDLSFQGTFSQAIDYIQALQALAYYLKINSLNIKGATVDDEGDSLSRPSVDDQASINLNLTVYLQ